jgi:hypothetical protein
MLEDIDEYFESLEILTIEGMIVHDKVIEYLFKDSSG